MCALISPPGGAASRGQGAHQNGSIDIRVFGYYLRFDITLFSRSWHDHEKYWDVVRWCSGSVSFVTPLCEVNVQYPRKSSP